MSGVVVGGTLPIFFSPFFCCAQRRALREFILAVLMPFSVLVGGVVASSLAARQERPGNVERGAVASSLAARRSAAGGGPKRQRRWSPMVDR